MKNVENLIEVATRNASEDRAATKILLTNLMLYMKSSDDRHREVGMVAAKYVETLQRSNEQLVKIATMLQKKNSQEQITEISASERDELFELINSGDE